MEKKYKELNATAKLSPQAILQQLIQNISAQKTQAAPTGFKIRIKPNELKPKQ